VVTGKAPRCAVRAWPLMDSNPKAYFSRHVAPGVVQRTGGWDAEEKQRFLEAVKATLRTRENGELTAAPGEVESRGRRAPKATIEDSESSPRGRELIEPMPAPVQVEEAEFAVDPLLFVSSKCGPSEGFQRKRHARCGIGCPNRDGPGSRR
jgi:hypothetical protein